MTTTWTASWWKRLAHWNRCGGGCSSYDPRTGESRCGFCDFLYDISFAGWSA